MSSAENLGLYLQALPLNAVQHFAQSAEQTGYDSVWFPEITFADAFIPAASVVPSTDQINLATGLVGIWSRSPVTMAMEAATLNQYCDGRLILGLGLQSRTYVENWHGQTYERPVQAMREYIQILRGILSGERTTVDGDIFQVQGFKLDAEPAPDLPIYVAAIGPKMTQLVGELADGLLGYFYSRNYLIKEVLPNLEQGAERSGRSLEDIDVACGFPSLIRPEGDPLKEIRGQIVMFATAMASSPYYKESIEQAGFSSQLEAIQEYVEEGNMEAAMEAVPREMSDAFTISGSPEEAARRIDAYFAAGLDSVLLNPAPPNMYFPLYEGHFPEGVTPPPFPEDEFQQVVQQVLEMPSQL